MSLRPSTVASALEYAEFLHDDGSPRAAAAIVRALVDAYDPAMPCADRQMLRAADLFARTAVDDPKSVAYARFAERNAQTLLGRRDQLTISAMQTLVAVCVRYDHADEAVTVCGRLIDALNEQGEPAVALTWRRERAALLHADGQCDQALDEIRACAHLGEQLLVATERRTAARHAVIATTIMLAACGDTTGALSVVRRHGDLLSSAGSLERRADEAAIAAQIDSRSAQHRRGCTRSGLAEQADGPPPLAFWTTAIHRAGQR
jgi:hypothetical protein